MNAIQDDFLLNEFLESFIVSLFVGEYREKKKSFSRFLNFFSDTHWRDLMCWIGFFQIGDLGVTRPLQRQHRLQTLPQYNRETLPSWRVAAPCARNTGWVLSLVDIISHPLRQSWRRWLVSSHLLTSLAMPYVKAGGVDLYPLSLQPLAFLFRRSRLIAPISLDANWNVFILQRWILLKTLTTVSVPI